MNNQKFHAKNILALMVPTGSPFLIQNENFLNSIHHHINVAKTININYQKANHLKKIL